MEPIRFLPSIVVLLALMSMWITTLPAQVTEDQTISYSQHNQTNSGQHVINMPTDPNIKDPVIGKWQIGERSWPVYQGSKGGWYIMRVPINKDTGQPDVTKDIYKQYVEAARKDEVLLQEPSIVLRE